MDGASYFRVITGTPRGIPERTPDFGAWETDHHQGYSTDIATRGGIMHVALGYNPSYGNR